MYYLFIFRYILYFFCLYFQFNDISIHSGINLILLNRSVESDVTYTRGPDTVNQRNVTARNFYSVHSQFERKKERAR